MADSLAGTLALPDSPTDPDDPLRAAVRKAGGVTVAALRLAEVR